MLNDTLKAITALVFDVERRRVVVRLAYGDTEWIATVEVHEDDGGAHPLFDAVGEMKQRVAKGEQLDEFYVGLIEDLAALAKNVRERGEIRPEQGRGPTPEAAVANLFDTLRESYKDMLDRVPGNPRVN